MLLLSFVILWRAGSLCSAAKCAVRVGTVGERDGETEVFPLVEGLW